MTLQILLNIKSSVISGVGLATRYNDINPRAVTQGYSEEVEYSPYSKVIVNFSMVCLYCIRADM